MKYYLEFRDDNKLDMYPSTYDTINDLVTSLIEWYQLVSFFIRVFNSFTTIEKKVNPNQLVYLLPVDKEITVFKVKGYGNKCNLVVYAKEN